jgi:hypothetical protein
VDVRVIAATTGIFSLLSERNFRETFLSINEGYLHSLFRKEERILILCVRYFLHKYSRSQQTAPAIAAPARSFFCIKTGWECTRKYAIAGRELFFFQKVSTLRRGYTINRG